MSIGPCLRPPAINIKDNKIYLRCDYVDKDKAKQIPGYRWDKTTKSWEYPLSFNRTTVECKLVPLHDVLQQ